MSDSSLHIRIPAKLKKAAQKIAEANGLDLSSVIRMYLVHMEVRGTIPLPPLTINGYTEEAEQEILRRMKEPGIRVKNMKEYFKKIGV